MANDPKNPSGGVPPATVRDHRHPNGSAPASPSEATTGPVIRDHRTGASAGVPFEGVPGPANPRPVSGHGGGVGVTPNPALKHVFVLMLENRSFDHMLGFSGIVGYDAVTDVATQIEGLKGNESNTYNGQSFKVSTGAADRLGVGRGPGHGFGPVLEQLCGRGAHYTSGGAYPPIDCSGYASHYAKVAGDANAGKVMQCFGPHDLPILNALAKEFVVCDHWFSSMPGPTEPNRMFAHAATSGGFDDTPGDAEIGEAMFKWGGGFTFPHGNIFQRLRSAGVKFRIYADDSFPNVAELRDVSITDDIESFEDFASHVMKPSYNASYTFIEPSYDALDHFEDGNSQHPSGSAAAGDRFIKQVYEALRKSPLWENSMLVITWDEHGGFYDHVAPPATVASGGSGRDHGFTFQQLGPRVPALVISPLVPRNRIDHRLYEHSSIPATIEHLFGLAPMTDRDAHANGLHLLATLDRARTDAPLTLPLGPLTRSADRHRLAEATSKQPEAPLSDDPDGNLAALARRVAFAHIQVRPDQEQAVRARVAQLRTRGDLLAYMKEVDALVRAKRQPATAPTPVMAAHP